MILIKQICLRFKLAWSALLGKEMRLYQAILNNQPVAINICLEGTLIATDNAILVNCTVCNPNGSGDGFIIGNNSIIIGCIAEGWRGHGITQKRI